MDPRSHNPPRSDPSWLRATPPWIDGNLDRLLDNLTDGVVVVEQGRVAWVNATLVELADAEKAEVLVGRPFDALFGGPGPIPIPTPEQRGEVATALARSRGEARSVAVRALPGARDEALWEVYLVRDLESEHGASSEILALGRSLREARQEGEALRERLQQEARENEHLLGVVSHELRTPITVVSGYSRILLSEEAGPLNDEQRRFLEECERSCRRLDRFVAELLGATKVLRSQEELDLQDAEVGSVLRAVAGFLRPLVDERGLEVAVQVEPDTPRARFDPMRIQQVVTNLLGNAIKYAARRVEVGARGLSAAGRRFVEVSVQDDGPGVPADERERIFQPYVQGQRGQAGGLGLGLAICKRIIDAHGGAIGVTGCARGGTRFYFSVPAAAAPGADPAGGAR